jgi:uncharacterized protein YecT (DUF1311 family)
MPGAAAGRISMTRPLARLWPALIAAALSGPAAAQSLVFDMSATLDCIARTDGYHARHACIGASAEACMERSAGGYSTVGMSGCIDLELQYWDGRLNRSYQALMAREREDDAGKPADWVPDKAPALRTMQRAWIPFRDATCDYERAQWGGGTGGGPATVGCLLRMTAEQTLFLESVDLGQ